MDNEVRARSQIQKIAENLSSTWYVKNEINLLPTLIRDNEDVIYLTSGCLTDKKADSAIVALTNERIIFFDEMPFSVPQEYDILLTEINNISWKMDIGSAQITIEHGSKTEKVSNVNKDEADTFCRLTQRYINALTSKDKTTIIRTHSKSNTNKSNNNFIKIENRFIRKNSIIEVERINDFSLIITTSKVFNGTSFQVLKQFNNNDEIDNFLRELGVM